MRSAWALRASPGADHADARRCDAGQRRGVAAPEPAGPRPAGLVARDEQAEQKVRRAKLEEERVRDAALVAQMESDHMKSLQVPLGRIMRTCTPLT